jgi:hypothetical protein
LSSGEVGSRHTLPLERTFRALPKGRLQTRVRRGVTVESEMLRGNPQFLDVSTPVFCLIADTLPLIHVGVVTDMAGVMPSTGPDRGTGWTPPKPPRSAA